MLHSEHATKGGRFHRAEKKTTQRERQQVVKIGYVNCWKSEWRQPLWHLAQQFHTKSAEIHARSNEDAGNNYEQRDWFALKKSFAQQQHGERSHTEQQRWSVRFSQV